MKNVKFLFLVTLMGSCSRENLTESTSPRTSGRDVEVMTIDRGLKEVQTGEWHPLMIIQKVRIRDQERSAANLIKLCRLVIECDRAIRNEAGQTYPIPCGADVSTFIMRHSVTRIEVFEGELVFVSDLAKAAQEIIDEYENKGMLSR